MHAPMDMKAMMFAGLGLFAAMVPTTMWISSDMRAIEAKERAQLAAECSQRPASPTPLAPAVDPSAQPPGGSGDSATAGTAPDPCATLDGFPVGTATTEEPATGLPVADPYAGQVADPVVGTGATPDVEYPASDF